MFINQDTYHFNVSIKIKNKKLRILKAGAKKVPVFFTFYSLDTDNRRKAVKSIKIFNNKVRTRENKIVKLERIFIRISEEEKDFYKREAEKRDMSLSELIRQALKNEINKEN